MSNVLCAPAPVQRGSLEDALRRSIDLEASIYHLPDPERSTRRRAARQQYEDEAAYAARRCDEEALLAKYRPMMDLPDATLIGIVADPPALMGDFDEVTAVAAIVLERRLSGVLPSVAAA